MKIRTAIAVTAMTGVAFALTGTAFADQTEQNRSVGSFSRIKNSGPMTVNVSVGEATSVHVRADSKDLENIITEVRGDMLYVELEHEGRSWRNKGPIVVTVTTPSLEKFELRGSGDSVISGLTKGDFELELSGSGDITLEKATLEKFSLELKGSGDIEASGSCTSIDVELKGSGDVDVKDMECGDGDISVMGSGDVQAHLKGAVDVSIMGSGDVALTGSPRTLDTRTLGSGEVRVR